MNSDLSEKKQLSPLKQAYLKLEEMQSRLVTLEQERTEPIAITGVGCRFPGGANDPDQFWDLLRDGRDAIRNIPAERWDVDAYFDPDPKKIGKMYTRRGAFLDQVDLFDPQFFGIAPREALGMDPQQRLLLEVAWEALENGGIAPNRLSGTRTGVFLGLCTSDYANLQVQTNDLTQLDAYSASGIAHSIASGRLSYVLGLQGPSVTLDTACSSSLVAVHLACQSLRTRECQMALAGGVNVILSPDTFVALCKVSMLSPDGYSKTFDEKADGFGRGEGCGIIVLKRLSDALTDGDRILALIRGSAVNQDGPSSGLTAPNGPSQIAVIEDALLNGKVHPAEVTYVEAHGTGTSLGDPIEVQALGAVYGRERLPEKPLFIGALKTNIGHLEGAAGIAGLIKVMLSLQHREIPATLHLERLNPYIPWDELPLEVVTRLTAWEPGNIPRMAGVSSFGFSGTNAHILLQEAPLSNPIPTHLERPLHPLALSASQEGTLNGLVDKYSAYFASHEFESLANVCHTANSGRAHLPHRAFLVAESMHQMRDKLLRLANGEFLPNVFKGQKEGADKLKVSFLFTGQGSQYVGMGRGLYETEPGFRKRLESCEEILGKELDEPLLSVLYGEAGGATVLDETRYTQPALYCLEYALAELWGSWGISPSVVMGHSVGEYAAACLAGVFSFEDGLKLIAARGRLMQEQCERGAMAAIWAEEERVAVEVEVYRGEIAIAALNGPQNTVISGRKEAIGEILKKFEKAGIRGKSLTVSHAFHSPMMEPMLKGFEKVAMEVRYMSPRLPLISNLTGRVVGGEEISKAGYWVRHVSEPVRFSASMQALHERGERVFLEVGPTPTLLAMGKKCLPEGYGSWIPSLRKGKGDWQEMLSSLGALYVQGAEVDWVGFDRNYPRRRVVLPTYPFQRQRYWFESARNNKTRASRGSQDLARNRTGHPFLGHRLESPFIKDTIFESDLSLDTLPFIGD
ncbi:MAG: beta-ketoacyl synthase N-terminal-like domain-containing protein, partial [Terriglobia bacterium]